MAERRASFSIGSAVATLAVLVGAGCNMAPTYERPASPVTEAWPASAGETQTNGVAASDIGWRDVFGDPRLVALIDLALRNNRDLRIAALNVELARAQYRIQRSEQFPTLAGVGSVDLSGRSKGIDFGAASDDEGGAQVNGSYTVGLSVTSFELDLWGRVRNLKDAALEQYLASKATRRSAHLSLVAEVASQYLVLQATGEQLALARRTLRALRSFYDLTRRQFEEGIHGELEVRAAEGQVEAARADIARLTRERALAENALVLLVGRPLPRDLPAGLPFADEDVLADIPAGLPSDLLTRRPDILAAEHQLKAANADIGAARAAFFPTISLTALGGIASTALTGLFGGTAALWSFTPQITAPIFTGGRLEGNLDAAHVRKHIEIAEYEKAIQVAFREVADALAGREPLDRQVRALEKSVDAQRRRQEISELRYRTGIENYLSVLLAQRDLYVVEARLIDVRLARMNNVVSLYKALGGGWRERSRD
ncbi:MAG: efflux transporter outer membrane subunit [Polyangiaceae bacterium]|nr:efflux transporter outer membrane subunit [Polyangiaceae bacterium]